jgi:hypothetical protein
MKSPSITCTGPGDYALSPDRTCTGTGSIMLVVNLLRSAQTL